MLLVVVLAALAAVPGARSKVYERCELARELRYVHRTPMDQVPVWVCIARHESEFNTTAVGHVGDGGDHGLFQISDLYWCSHRGKGKACSASCAQFLDDSIADDVDCVRRIHREHQGLTGNGFNAWAVYAQHCKRPERAAKYVEGCFAGTGNELEPQEVYGLPPPAITAPPPPARPHARPQAPQAPKAPPQAMHPTYGLPSAPSTSTNAVSSRSGFGFSSFPGLTSNFRGWTTPSRFAASTAPSRFAAPRAAPSRFASPKASQPHQDSPFWTWQTGPKRRWF